MHNTAIPVYIWRTVVAMTSSSNLLTTSAKKSPKLCGINTHESSSSITNFRQWTQIFDNGRKIFDKVRKFFNQ